MVPNKPVTFITRQKHFLSSNLKVKFSLIREKGKRKISIVKYVFLYGVNVTTSVVQVCLRLVAAYISSKVFFLPCCTSLKRRTFFQSSPLTLASTCPTKSRKHVTSVRRGKTAETCVKRGKIVSRYPDGGHVRKKLARKHTTS